MASAGSQAKMGILEKEVWTEAFISIFYYIFATLTKHFSASRSTVKIIHDIISSLPIALFLLDFSLLGRETEVSSKE